MHTVVAAATRTLSSGTAAANLTLHGANVFGTVRAKTYARGEFLFRPELGYEAVYLPEVRGQTLPKEYFLILPAKVYFGRSSREQTTLYNGKRWISAALTGPESRDPHFVEQVEGLSPQLLLDEILWGGVSASHVGDPVLNHVPVAEYRVSVNLTRALSAATGPSAGAMKVAITAELAALRASQPAGGSESVPVTVWVDGPGRVVRLRAALPGSGLGTVSMTLFGFGAKVRASFPPESDVVDITSLKQSGASTPGSPWIFGG